jgi:hypothetical protein
MITDVTSQSAAKLVSDTWQQNLVQPNDPSYSVQALLGDCQIIGLEELSDAEESQLALQKLIAFASRKR